MWLFSLQTALLIHSGSLTTCGSSASKPLYLLSTQALWQHVAPRPPNHFTYPLRLSCHLWLISLSAAAPLIHSGSLTTCGSSASKPLYLSTQALWPHVAPWIRTALHIHSGSLAICGSSASVLLLNLSTQALWLSDSGSPRSPNSSTYPLRLPGHMWLLCLRTALLIHSGPLATCGYSASVLLLHLSTPSL